METPAAGVSGPDPSVGSLVAAARARAQAEALVLEAVAGVAAECRRRSLADLGQGGAGAGCPGQDPDGDVGRAWAALSATEQARIEDDVRRRAVTEVVTALGIKVWEARLMVGLMMAGEAVTSLAAGALGRGETSWPQLRRFWELAGSKARKLTEDQQELIAQALFGTDAGLAAVERLDPEGQLELGVPWAQERFEGAVEREVRACEGVDVVTERDRRRRARAARRCSVRVHDDGTATFSVRGPIHTVLAAHARHDNVARTLRAAGHPDSIAALAADSAVATLVHGTLEVPGGQVDELSEADLEDLIAVVNGHPRVTLQVIVPADILGLGHPVCATCADVLDPTPAPAGRGARAGDHRGQVREREEDESEPRLPFDSEGAADPPPWARPDPGAPDTADSDTADPDTAGDAPDLSRAWDAGESSAPGDGGESSADRDDGGRREPWGYDPSARQGRGQVAEIIGSHPAFLTPGQARELFYFPGTTMHRIMTDPADGRCLERTIAAYRPDADMRRQVRAADVYSRHPMSRKTGRSLEIDHVIPYSTDPQGTTTEANLANLDLRTHQVKTLGELLVTINARRDLTFTTLLSQITGSRAHDYRQYLRAVHPEDLDDQADLADQALLAALAHHPERWAGDPDSWLSLDHTDPTTGRIVRGAHPDTPHPHQLLDITSDGTGTGESDTDDDHAPTDGQ